MKKYQYRFTVFTPTYNRAHTLHRVFDSLMQQTFKNFEWLIVDDGSTDDTQNVVEEFKNKAWFPIRYIYQKNGGKHRAVNRAVTEAHGELFLISDSDDWCAENALERFDFHWNNIPKDKKKKFAAIAVLSKNSNGQMDSDKFPENVFDTSQIEIDFKYNIKGDQWLLLKTDILREYSFPEFKGERFIAESSVWHEIAKRYQTRGINEVLRIHEYLDEGLSSKSKKLRKQNVQGTIYTYTNQILLDIPLKYKIKALVNCIRFTIYNRKLFIKCVKTVAERILKKRFK